MLDGHLYLLLDMGSGTTKTRAMDRKVNDGEWYHVDFQRDGRSGRRSPTGDEMMKEEEVGGVRCSSLALPSLKPFSGNISAINASLIIHNNLN